MPRIDCNTLPPAARIDHPVIAASAAAHAAAQQALGEAQRAVGRLDGGREQARERDAEEAATAFLADKPAPKRRHEAAFDKALDAAEHKSWWRGP